MRCYAVNKGETLSILKTNLLTKKLYAAYLHVKISHGSELFCSSCVKDFQHALNNGIRIQYFRNRKHSICLSKVVFSIFKYYSWASKAETSDKRFNTLTHRLAIELNLLSVTVFNGWVVLLDEDVLDELDCQGRLADAARAEDDDFVILGHSKQNRNLKKILTST